MIDVGAITVMSAATFVVAAALTGLLVRYAPALKLIDVPNARSSHTRPTPRGGGVAIVVSFVATVLGATVLGMIPARAAAGLLSPGLAVAAVGLIDDRYGLPAVRRLAVHLLAAASFLALSGGVPVTGVAVFDEGWAVAGAVGVLAIAWSINFSNFMDGIDGIAASQAVFVAAGIALIGAVGGQAPMALLGAVAAAAATGFLVWNWSPARIFMGDAGSGFLGYLLAALAVLALGSGIGSLWAMLMLPAVFVTDATVTLVVRAIRREPIQQAHRSHAYQHLARRWNSHSRVALLYMAINIGLVAPLAALAWQRPTLGGALALLVYGPLVVAALYSGAGRP